MIFEDSKNSIEAGYTQAFHQLVTGCNRSICLNPLCQKNPRRAFSDEDSVRAFLERIAESTIGGNIWKSPSFIFCSSFTASPSFLALFSSLEALRQVYSKPETLVQFFAVPNSLQPDLSKIQEVHAFIARQIEDESLSENWLVRLTKDYDRSSYSQLYLARSLFILLVQGCSYRRQLLKLSELVKSNAYMHDELSQHLDILPAESFGGIVRSLQSFLTQKADGRLKPRGIKEVDAVLCTLNLFYKSNCRTKVISPMEFFNPAISQRISVREEFRIWRQPHKRRLPLHKRFSFLNYPWVLDLERKARIIQLENHESMHTHMNNSILHMIIQGTLALPYLNLSVRRDHLVQDTIEQLLVPGINLKKPLKVSFVGEEGVDEGGLRKEFFHLVVRELVNVRYGMFRYREDERVFWFNPLSLDSKSNFELIGVVIGMAIYNGVNLDVRFPLCFYKKVQNSGVGLEDLSQIDRELYNGLKQLLKFDGDVASVYCRNFMIEISEFGQSSEIELIPGGKDIPVTNENRQEFVDRYSAWLLLDGIHKQFEAFKRGILKVCGGHVLKSLLPEELETLICGFPTIDLEELERNTKYENGYTRDSHVIQMLWRILHSLTEKEKKQFLFFATGSDRVPVTGFASLNFTISRNGDDPDRLMTAHTCFNHLLLPDYQEEEQMREKLLIAIQNSEGFGLK